MEESRDPLTGALRGVYLRPLAGGSLPVRHSVGARARAAQLLAFLGPLQEVGAGALKPPAAPALIVANSRDWRRLCSYPYGLPFTRNLPGPAALLFAAADYPPRFLRAFDSMLLKAAKEGHRAPGQVGEFVDLMVGHEWGHSLANLSGLRTRVRWLDELIATYLFVAALKEAGMSERLARLKAWAELQVAGTNEYRGDLAQFEYPRTRSGMNKLLWYQGVFTLKALELAASRGFGFPLELRSHLPAAHRGEVAKGLVAAEPSFREWFRIFGRSGE